jgi:hypothetical protein
VCCAFTFCWWANIDLLEEDAPPGVTFRREETASTSLRKVRTWLEPYVMLMRYWKAYSEKPPPKELRRQFEWVFLCKGLYRYAH